MRRALKTQKRLPKKVICIGNLTVGGSGKTPAVIALVGESVKRGLIPCVLTRGYKGKLKGIVLITKNMSARDAGDEPLLIANKSDALVVKGRVRYDSAMFALNTLRPEPDIFLMDDGYQHFGLHRDINVLLINAMEPIEGLRLLPFGRLREPLSAMQRADAIVITNSVTDNIDSIMDVIRKHNNTAPVFKAIYKPCCLMDADGVRKDTNFIGQSPVYAFSGIANPLSFEGMLKKLNLCVAGFKTYSDHHIFNTREIEFIKAESRRLGAIWIVTTEKDIMRLKDMQGLPDNLMALSVELVIENGFYDYVFRRLAQDA